MTGRWSWQQCAKELRGAQSTLARADVKHRRPGDDWQASLTTRARLAIAEALRMVRVLQADARTAKGRRAA